MVQQLRLTSIRIDGDTQLRSETNQEVIQSYAQDMLAGDLFPPVVVYHDNTNYWLSDGFHRYHAAQAMGNDEISADVRQGSRRDALLHAAEANRKHGLQLSNKDKRRIVTLFLNDPEWSKWSDREIAKRCGVSHPFVSSLRSSLETVNSERTYMTKHGTVATMNVTRIGNDPYEGLSEYLVKKCEEVGMSPDEIAAAATWARGYKADIKRNAGMALLVGGWMLHCKEGNHPRIGDPPYTQEQLEKEAWRMWRLVPQDLDVFYEIGELEESLHAAEVAKGKDFFDVTHDDIVDLLPVGLVEELANCHTQTMFRTWHTTWHYTHRWDMTAEPEHQHPELEVSA